MTVLSMAVLPRSANHMGGKELDEALVRVGRFVADAGLGEVYGVQVLHRHFRVGPREAIVEHTEDDTLCLRVVPRRKVAALAANIWGFTLKGVPVALQWSEDMAAITGVDPRLRAFGRFLVAERLAATFAVMALDDTIELEPDETLLEDANCAARTQCAVPVQRSEVMGFPAVAWKFAVGVPVAIRYCRLVPDSH